MSVPLLVSVSNRLVRSARSSNAISKTERNSFSSVTRAGFSPLWRGPGTVYEILLPLGHPPNTPRTIVTEAMEYEDEQLVEEQLVEEPLEGEEDDFEGHRRRRRYRR